MPEGPIDGGGEPPYDGGMEQRIVAVESRLSKVEDQLVSVDGHLVRVETTLTHLDREISQFKWWAAGSAIAIVLAMIASVLGTGIAIQQMTVSTFQAANQYSAQPAQPPIIINVPPIPTPPEQIESK